MTQTERQITEAQIRAARERAAERRYEASYWKYLRAEYKAGNLSKTRKADLEYELRTFQRILGCSDNENYESLLDRKIQHLIDDAAFYEARTEKLQKYLDEED